MNARPLCASEGCDRPAVTRRWCNAHYQYWRVHKVEPSGPILDTPEKRFWPKVDKNGPIPATFYDATTRTHKFDLSAGHCWLWTANLTTRPNGYGRFRLNGEYALAHRYLYELTHGPVPDGYELDHLCRVRRCVNPAHLEPVTRSENTLRGERNGCQHRTHCPAGHPYDEGNTYRRPSDPSRRLCGECMRTRSREAQRAKRRQFLADCGSHHAEPLAEP